ncbi:hypothetical protein DMB42_21030 [Nonomuraea sp. WAC 01424]|uniref:hypothetical protein n=1 Tax=Nonomuraea sp. WAC 01424 TaxID=2203200 RepID=UPI000F7A220C|nr:hypothetical protein [Nonomuraea sp. WAC 01424]RSN08506.1 hypothetical protein DMB42_21030 [Nonomuraea sp. WAC 01424]
MRLLVHATAAALVLGGLALPARAATVTHAYGYAWADGTGSLRIVPMKPAKVRRSGNVLYKLTPVPGAKELKLDYTRAAYSRVTTACGLKETEGRVALDRDGLGRTACKPAQLTVTLLEGAVPLRVEYQDGKAVKAQEFLLDAWPEPRTARGTVERIDDATVLFRSGGRQVKLGYTYMTSFYRATARCGDRWVSGRPSGVDKRGLGTKPCEAADLTKALKGARRAVQVEVSYTPDANSAVEVWEVARRP